MRPMRDLQRWLPLALASALYLAAAPARAITLQVDYTYDTSGFFGPGNPQGAVAGLQAKAALETAADFFSDILNDTFSEIVVPPDYHSLVYDTVVSWNFKMRFDHPTTGAFTEVVNPTVPNDRYIIFAGAQGLSGTTAGVGGPGGFSRGSGYTGSGSVTQAENAEINQITATFFNAVDNRGEPGGFARWGGVISFDSTPAAPWHYNLTTPPAGNVIDFFSVAIHELGHALGFGSQSDSGTTEWEALVSGSTFVGANAMAQNGGLAVPLSADLSHWAVGKTSVVYSGSTSQETAMDPDLQNGTRKRWTELDAAALKDIGWELIPLPELKGDYNDNGIVDAADYVLWQDTRGQSVPPGSGADGSGNGFIGNSDYEIWKSNFGAIDLAAGAATAAGTIAAPEPAGWLLALMSGIAVQIARRKRRG